MRSVEATAAGRCGYDRVPSENRIDRYWCGLPKRAFNRCLALLESTDLTSMLRFTVAHLVGTLRLAYLYEQWIALTVSCLVCRDQEHFGHLSYVTYDR